VDTTRARRRGPRPGTGAGPRPGPRSLLVLVGVAVLIGAAATAAIALAVLDLGPGRASGTSSAPDRTTAAASDPSVRSDRGFALWGTTQDGEPLRWDACTPVTFVLSETDAPAHAETDLRIALRMLADATGLELVLLGTTDERPTADRPLVERDGDGWRWRPVLVAWVAPGETDVPLTPLDRGVALPVAVRDGGRESFVTGQVVLNARRSDLVAGFGDRSDAIGATLLHELAHVLGLDHVHDPSELMSTDPGTGPVEFGAGDLRGLRAIGVEAGCRPAPPASSGRGLTPSPTARP
jgi:hypothetical protein